MTATGLVSFGHRASPFLDLAAASGRKSSTSHLVLLLARGGKPILKTSRLRRDGDGRVLKIYRYAFTREN